MTQHPYIAIEGVIGVGKTTLARFLQPVLESETLLEEFDENPFLSSFYGDRERYAFQTQIFFLLSRYHQQKTVSPASLAQKAVVSDYTFAKDRLFANLTLQGDELIMYHTVHDALAEKITRPSLLVFLQADVDILMGRITQRDRSYERNMDRDYIAQLAEAYELFVKTWTAGPKLVIDTNGIDFVQNSDDLNAVIERIKSELSFGVHQQSLPGIDHPVKSRET